MGVRLGPVPPCVDQTAFGLWQTAFGLWQTAFGLWQTAFGLWQTAFGLWALLGSRPRPK